MALNEIDLYKFRRKTYSTAKEIAEVHKVSPRKFRARMIAGWPIEEALEVVKRANPKGKAVTVDGQFFATRRDVAKHFGIEERTLNNRLSNGWTIEEAVGLNRLFLPPFSVSPIISLEAFFFWRSYQ